MPPPALPLHLFVRLLATLALCAPAALAGPPSLEEEPKAPPLIQPEAKSPFEVRIGVPGWLSGIKGDVAVRGIVNPVDVSFADLLKRLDAIAVLSLSVRYHRWELFADGQYLKVSDSVELPGLLFDRAHLGLKSAFVEAFLGYRLIDRDNAWLSMFAGMRYNYLSASLHAAKDNDPRFPRLRQRLGIPADLKVSGSVDWIDPVIGLQGKVRLYRPIWLYAEGDLGGFGAASDLTWQVQGGLEFQVSRWFYTDVGWRYLKYDYASGGFSNKTELNGPFVEAGVHF